MNQDTPAYVIDGEWDDAEWREIAAKGAARTEGEKMLYAQGPRPHPWGPLAYRVNQPDGGSFIFPSKDHYEAWDAAKRSAQKSKPNAKDA